MSETRTRILRRRAKLIAAALATAGSTTAACGSQVCLSIAVDPDAATMDATPDMGPQVCLTPAIDSGVDTGTDSTTDAPGDSPSDSPSDGEEAG